MTKQTADPSAPRPPIRSARPSAAHPLAHLRGPIRCRGGRGALTRTGIRALAVLLLALAPLIGSAAFAADPDAIVGRWHTEDQDGNRDSIVEITRSGESYVGRVVWLKYDVYPENDPRGWAGRPVVDRENPDPALRARSVLGVEVLTGLRFDGEGWSGGAIYTPRKGETYKARAWLEGAETLKIRGYFGTPWLGRTVTWRRAPASGENGSE